jgi:iron complex transport system substrate-binding protein
LKKNTYYSKIPIHNPPNRNIHNIKQVFLLLTDLFVLGQVPLILALMFINASCTGGNSLSNENSDFTDSSTVIYAKRLRIEHKEGYSQVSVINPWQGAQNYIHKWYLIPEKKSIPEFLDSSAVIRVPVRRIVCMSTTHLAMISAINESESVIGFSGIRFLYDHNLRQSVQNGNIREIGYEENLNKELIIELEPELIIIYGIGSESAGYIGKLKELGIKILYNADYLETDPLGKAEWIKLFGLLYDKEKIADSIFKSIEREYNSIKSSIRANISNRPKVLLGLPYEDTWFISPGNSYISRLIEDAGGEYIWQDTDSQESMPFGLENVFIKALSADYWLNTGDADRPEQILSIDPRFSVLPCFIKGNIYNNNKRINANGGNDYWEGGTINPQIILADIASILHPDLFSGRELFYYKQVK